MHEHSDRPCKPPAVRPPRGKRGKPARDPSTQSVAIATLTLNPSVDKSAEVARVLPDRKLRCGRPRFEPGGGGINVARAIRRLGGEATALYPVGGHSGRLFEQLLDAEEIPRESILIDEATRVNLIVQEKETGQQFRFGMPGPRVEEREWRTLLETLYGWKQFPGYVVVSGSLPTGVSGTFYELLAGRVSENDSRLVVDSSQEGLREALKVGAFLIKPNLRELRQLTGTDESVDDEQVVAAARSLIQAGRCAHVLVSQGRRGAVLVSQESHCVIRAPTVAVKSRVGAGDSMVGGLTLTLARGGSEREAAVFGVAAGAAAVMTDGTELCRREDAERLRGRIRVREGRP